MKKVLVTTDLSKNAKAGLRFAIQLATQVPVALTFFYSYHLMKPTSWSDTVFTAFQKILGTTTSSLVNFSTVPVIVVPNNYRTKSIKNLLYFSDLDDLDIEL